MSTFVIKKFKRNIQDYGLPVAMKKTLLFCFKPVFEKTVYRIYRIDLDNYEPVRRNDLPFEFKIIESGHTDLIRQIEGMEEWLEGKVKSKLSSEQLHEKLTSRIGSSGLCLVALDGDNVAGFNLVAFGEVYMPLVKKTRKFKGQEAWSEQITVHKNFRKRGLGAELRFRMFDELKKRGILRFYGGTLQDNEANLRLSRKVGFKVIVDIHYKRIFSKKIWQYKKLSN